MTARTLYDKLWQSHLVHEEPDGTSLIYIDRHLLHEVTSPQAFEGLALAGRKPAPVGDLSPASVGKRSPLKMLATNTPQVTDVKNVLFAKDAKDAKKSEGAGQRDYGHGKRTELEMLLHSLRPLRPLRTRKWIGSARQFDARISAPAGAT